MMAVRSVRVLVPTFGITVIRTARGAWLRFLGVGVSMRVVSATGVSG